MCLIRLEQFRGSLPHQAGKSAGSGVGAEQVRGGCLGGRPDHSDGRTVWACFRPCAPSAVLRLHNHREPNGKGRTLSPGAGGDDIPPHEPTETPADGEAQSRAPILLGRRGDPWTYS